MDGRRGWKVGRRDWEDGEEKGRRTGVMGEVESGPLHGKTVFPFLLNGVKVWGARDDGCDMTIVDTALKEVLNIKEEKFTQKIDFFDASDQFWRSVRVYEAEMQAFGVMKFTTYIGVVDFGEQARGRVLVGMLDCQDMGMTVTGIPHRFPTDEEVKSDHEWLAEDMTKNCDMPLPDEMLKVVTDGVEEALRKNQELPDDTHCKRKDSYFHITMKKGGKPWFQRNYPVRTNWEAMVDDRVQQWMERRRIEPLDNSQPFSSPLLPQKKVSGGKVNIKDIRLCLDFRMGNDNTEDPQYGLPLGEEIWNWMEDATIITELDLMEGFHQIVLHVDSRYLTAFTDRRGRRWQWQRMFFGAKGAVGWFQLQVETTMREHQEYTKVYVDNIFMKSTGPLTMDLVEDHAKKVAEGIKTLTEDGWKLKPSKCNFGMQRLKVMGSIVEKGVRRVDIDKVSAFASMSRPRTGKEAQRTAGVVGYLRDYIPLASHIMHPLNMAKKLKTISDKQWREMGGPECLKQLIIVLKSDLVISSVDWTKIIFVGTDASQYGVGVVLYQIGDDGVIRFIAFSSKSFTKTQTNYSAPKRELFAILHALQKYRHWLYAAPFVVECDQKALTFIQQATSYMVTDWMQYIMGFQFTVVHKPGFQNILPDALSRMYSLMDLDSRREHPQVGRHVMMLFLDEDREPKGDQNGEANQEGVPFVGEAQKKCKAKKRSRT